MAKINKENEKKYGRKQMVLFNGKGKKFEALNTSFEIERVQINIMSYDTTTNKQKSLFTAFLSFQDIFELRRKTKTYIYNDCKFVEEYDDKNEFVGYKGGGYSFNILEDICDTRENTSVKPFNIQGGVSEKKLHASKVVNGRTTSEAELIAGLTGVKIPKNKALSRIFFIDKGQKQPWIARIQYTEGSSQGTGIIPPSKEPNRITGYIDFGLTDAQLHYFVDRVSLEIEAYLKIKFEEEYRRRLKADMERNGESREYEDNNEIHDDSNNDTNSFENDDVKDNDEFNPNDYNEEDIPY